MNRVTKELINDRIQTLFGCKVGKEKGDFYYDIYYQCIFEVVNDKGGVQHVLRTGTPKQTLNTLNTILEYKCFITNKDLPFLIKHLAN